MFKKSVTALVGAMIGLGAVQAHAIDQYIMISFDGSKSVDWWNKTRDLARASGANVTYFANAVYFLNNDIKTLYTNPTYGRGKSAIGFGGKKSDILPRVQKMLEVADAGNEIGSHANGHYAGTGNKWNYNQWASEFNQFHEFMFNILELNGINDRPTQARLDDLMQDSFWGFRAPQLETTSGLFSVMKDNVYFRGDNLGRRYVYDASGVAGQDQWPYKRDGVWRFPLATLTIMGTRDSNGKERPTLSMDYNFMCTQSRDYGRGDCSEDPRANFANHRDADETPQAQRYEEQMYNTYMRWFKKNYNGNRVPMNIGHHFANWNGEAYYRALYRFASDVCRLPEVKCINYKQMVAFLESRSAPAHIQRTSMITSDISIPKEFTENYSAEDLEVLRMGDSSQAHFHDASAD